MVKESVEAQERGKGVKRRKSMSDTYTKLLASDILKPLGNDGSAEIAEDFADTQEESGQDDGAESAR